MRYVRILLTTVVATIISTFVFGLPLTTTFLVSLVGVLGDELFFERLL